MAQYRKGQTGNPSGRPNGAQNKLTKTVKETVAEVFDELQKDPKNSLLAFAKKYPRDCYNIAARLIPHDIYASVSRRKVGKDLMDELKANLPDEIYE